MKILIFTDNHFCETSSIIRKYGTKYTLRLENQIKSLNWVEKLAKEKSCDMVICAGDFFDKAQLTDQELTALGDINWNGLPHYFLVGNHESSVNGLKFNSTKALEGPNRYIISEPKVIDLDKTELAFLPYVIESDRKPIKEYFTKSHEKALLISHNDIKGIQMGPVISQTGFEIADIESYADLTVNGHLHNGQPISKKIINLGNLTGINFSEDATRYSHNAMIVDTDTLTYDLIENPYAFNFYKLEINNRADLAKFGHLSENAVLSIKCNKTYLAEVQEILSKINVIESRIIITKDLSAEEAEIDMSDFSVDHIAKFIECAKERYGTNAILEAELAEICK